MTNSTLWRTSQRETSYASVSLAKKIADHQKARLNVEWDEVSVALNIAKTVSIRVRLE